MSRPSQTVAQVPGLLFPSARQAGDLLPVSDLEVTPLGAIAPDDPLFTLAAFAALRPGDDAPDFLAELTRRPAWHADAACRGKGTDLFFPNMGQGAKPAKAVCSSCPVTEQCLDAALADPLTVGVWAGTSPAERAQIRKARKNAAA